MRDYGDTGERETAGTEEAWVREQFEGSVVPFVLAFIASAGNVILSRRRSSKSCQSLMTISRLPIS
jgi:hypothetical protein